MSISHLPVEILAIIGSYLQDYTLVSANLTLASIHDLGSFRLTCRAVAASRALKIPLFEHIVLRVSKLNYRRLCTTYRTIAPYVRRVTIEPSFCDVHLTRSEYQGLVSRFVEYNDEQLELGFKLYHERAWEERNLNHELENVWTDAFSLCHPLTQVEVVKSWDDGGLMGFQPETLFHPTMLRSRAKDLPYQRLRASTETQAMLVTLRSLSRSGVCLYSLSLKTSLQISLLSTSLQDFCFWSTLRLNQLQVLHYDVDMSNMFPSMTLEVDCPYLDRHKRRDVLAAFHQALIRSCQQSLTRLHSPQAGYGPVSTPPLGDVLPKLEELTLRFMDRHTRVMLQKGHIMPRLRVLNLSCREPWSWRLYDEETSDDDAHVLYSDVIRALRNRGLTVTVAKSYMELMR